VDTNQPDKRIKTVTIDRSKMEFRIYDLDSLIAEEHPARIIWELVGKWDLSAFEKACKTKEGEAGRPRWSAHLLVSMWVYSYTLGVASARAIARMSSHEPGLRWLTGDQKINYHTLSDFRVGHEEALRELFAQFLVMLEVAGEIDLKTILHDGTKMKAFAGKSSFHRRRTLEQRLKQARKVVRELDRRAGEAGEGVDEKQQAAQQRAARERLQRAEAAMEKLKKLEAKAAPKEKADVRVSDSEPEARKMKHPDGSFAPSYNVQVSTEGKMKAVVAVGVCTDTNDMQQLMPALERIQETTGALPKRIVADNGYASRSNIEQSSQAQVEVIAPWKDDASRQAGACKVNGIAKEFAGSEFKRPGGGSKLICPAGNTLVQIEQKMQHGVMTVVFQARAEDCSGCQYLKQCCGDRGGPRRVERVVESAEMKQYLARMKKKETRELYKKRCEVAEYPHLWVKAICGIRRFSVRGLVKVGMEAVWMALAYNVTQWIRVRPVAAAAA
jgi:transposase